jgi:hypothetical protein
VSRSLVTAVHDVLVLCKGNSMSTLPPNQADPVDEEISVTSALDLAAVPAIELLGLYSTDLMTAAAVKLGLFEGTEAGRDLAEARILIEGLAGLVTASAPVLGHHHAAPLRDGLKTLQLAFREASTVPDEPGQGPGEKFTGPVYS